MTWCSLIFWVTVHITRAKFLVKLNIYFSSLYFSSLYFSSLYSTSLSYTIHLHVPFLTSLHFTIFTSLYFTKLYSPYLLTSTLFLSILTSSYFILLHNTLLVAKDLGHVLIARRLGVWVAYNVLESRMYLESRTVKPLTSYMQRWITEKVT